jgi:hypothetical protein
MDSPLSILSRSPSPPDFFTGAARKRDRDRDRALSESEPGLDVEENGQRASKRTRKLSVKAVEAGKTVTGTIKVRYLLFLLLGTLCFYVGLAIRNTHGGMALANFSTSLTLFLRCRSYTLEHSKY